MSNTYDPNYVPKKEYLLMGQKAVVYNEENKILILQRSEKSGSGGKWALPGGAIDKGEDPIEGIKREITEETELIVNDIKPYSLRSYFDKRNDFVVIVGYTAKATSPTVVLNWEHDSYKWLTKEETKLLELTPDAKFFIEKLSD